MFVTIRKLMLVINLLAFCSVAAFASDNHEDGSQPLTPRTQRIANLETEAAIMKMQLAELQKQLNCFLDPDAAARAPFAVANAVHTEPLTINSLPHEIIGLILHMASHTTHPRKLAHVCKDWNLMMYQHANALPLATLFQVAYTNLSPYMKSCLEAYWENRFHYGALLFRPTLGSDNGMKRLDIATLGNPFCGTFDLTQCINQYNTLISDYLVITTDEEQFFKVRAENTDKVVILITLRHLLAKKITSKKDHPFAALSANWDADKAPVGIFWRWGNDANKKNVDHLTASSFEQVSACNLFANWQKSVEGHDGSGVDREMLYVLGQQLHVKLFHVRF